MIELFSEAGTRAEKKSAESDLALSIPEPAEKPGAVLRATHDLNRCEELLVRSTLCQSIRKRAKDSAIPRLR